MIRTLLSTAPDLLLGLWAVVIWASVLLSPGYTIAWSFNLLDFRNRPWPERLAWSVALSFAVVPILAQLVGRYLSLTAVCWLCALTVPACLVAVWLTSTRAAQASPFHRGSRILIAALALWTLLCIVELIDIRSASGSQLFLSTTVYDHALRTAFVDAVMRTGVPPINPLYWPGHGAPIRYYYFWYVLCGAVGKLAHVHARTSLIASCVWSAFGLIALIALFTRHFLDTPEPPARRQFFLGTALLLVTGLDIIPYLERARARVWLGDLEWWSWDQVASWFDTFLWVPHHAAALIACMTGFLLLWIIHRGQGSPWPAAVLAGLAFASAFGLSIWVAMGFAVLLLGWLLTLRSTRSIVTVLAAGTLAIVLLQPFFKEVRPADSAAQNAQPTHLFTVGARPMIPPNILENLPGFRTLWQTHPWLEQQSAMLLLMPLGYLLELGFFAIVLVLSWRSRRSLSDADRTALWMAIGCLILTSFLRSAVIAANDFGIRVMLIAQFFLLLLAARSWDSWKGRLRILMLSLAAIGVAGTVAQAVILRIYLPFMESAQQPGYKELSDRSAAFHDAYAELDTKIPGNAVIGYLPEKPDYYNLVQTLYLNRQALNQIDACNTSFGGNPAACEGIRRDLAAVFQDGSPAMALDLCRRWNINNLAASRWDPIWQHHDSWVWNLPAAITTPSIRVVACR